MPVQDIPSSTDVIARVFANMAAQWRLETALLSDSRKAAAHPNYRALVAPGSRVVPFMLRDLQSDQPAHWFIALQEITGENPVPPEQFGKIKHMAATWTAWGRTHGYLP